MQTVDKIVPLSSEPAGPAVLDVQGLCVDYRSAAGPLRIVSDLDLKLNRGERLALVGESGSGKSVTARALLRLDRRATVTGKVLLDGENLLELPEKKFRAVRGARMAMMFQDPLTTLNPVLSIGAQVAESLTVHGMDRKAAYKKAVSTLDRLGVARAAERMDAFPHEFSGGMRQRVCLAMAIVAEPDVLIADEPTTALDVRVQEQVLVLLDSLIEDMGLSVILITHDLGLVAGFADRVAVMYAGRKVEERTVDQMYATPRHPYTAGLLRSVPRLDGDVGRRLLPLPGLPPTPTNMPGGCRFHPRCHRSDEQCATEPPPLLPDGAGMVACHFPEPWVAEGAS